MELVGTLTDGGLELVSLLGVLGVGLAVAATAPLLLLGGRAEVDRTRPLRR